jgi:hypothetical protein
MAKSIPVERVLLLDFNVFEESQKRLDSMVAEQLPAVEQDEKVLSDLHAAIVNAADAEKELAISLMTYLTKTKNLPLFDDQEEGRTARNAFVPQVLQLRQFREFLRNLFAMNVHDINQYNESLDAGRPLGYNVRLL